MSDNKRKHERLNVNIKSEVHSEESMTFSKVVNISHGGIFISTPEPLNTGAEVSLSVKVPGEDALEIKGIVRWLKQEESEGKKAGMGIEFLGASEKEKNIIKKLLG